jgi:hypothetical protein
MPSDADRLDSLYAAAARALDAAADGPPRTAVEALLAEFDAYLCVLGARCDRLEVECDIWRTAYKALLRDHRRRLRRQGRLWRDELPMRQPRLEGRW